MNTEFFKRAAKSGKGKAAAGGVSLAALLVLLVPQVNEMRADLKKIPMLEQQCEASHEAHKATEEKYRRQWEIISKQREELTALRSEIAALKRRR